MMYTKNENKAVFAHAANSAIIYAGAFLLIWLIALFFGIVHKNHDLLNILLGAMAVSVIGYIVGFLKDFLRRLI